MFRNKQTKNARKTRHAALKIRSKSSCTSLWTAVFRSFLSCLASISKRSHLYSFLLLVALGIVWGSGYSLVKYATSNGVPPLGYAFWQSLGPAVFLSGLCFLRRKKWHISWHAVRYYAICGLIGISLPNTNMYFVAKFLPAGLLAVLVNTVPIFTYPIALACRQERFSLWRVSGVFIAFVGILWILLPGVGLPTTHALPKALQALASPICFAVCAVYINFDAPKHSDPLTLAASMLVASTGYLLPIVFHGHHFYVFHWPLNLADQAVCLEMLLSSVGYVLFFKLIRVAGPVYYSLVGAVVVATGIMWGRIFFDERWTFQAALCVLSVFVAIALVSWKQGEAWKA